MCVHACRQLYSDEPIVTAVNEYTLSFTHISNCLTISNVKVCFTLYSACRIQIQPLYYIPADSRGHLADVMQREQHV